MLEHQARFETRLFAPDGAELDSPWPEPIERSWHGILERSIARRFRDGSEGDLIRFLSMTSGDGPTALEGASLELRTFPNREVLALDLLEHAVGTHREADLLLPLWTALSPRLPDLEPGQTVRQRSNLPFMVDSARGVILQLDLTWSLEGPQPCPDQGECWYFTYTGPLEGRGLDRFDEHGFHYRLSGQVEGQVWVRTDTHAIVRSSYDWDLEVKATVSEGARTHPTAVVLQHQQHHGALSAKGGLP